MIQPSSIGASNSVEMPARIANALTHVRFTVSNEAALQRGIADVMTRDFAGAFVREHRLSAQCRPDFWFAADGIAVEVKWRPSGGSVREVVAQLARYASCEGVRAIVLATPSRRVIASVPRFVCGVPVTTAPLTTGL